MALARLRRGVLLRAPIRKIAQATALLAGVAHEGLFALRGGLVVKELAQHLQLGLKNGVAVNLLGAAIALAKLLGQLAHIILQVLRQELELRDGFNVQVERVDKAPRGGQVRRVLHRW